MIADRPNFQEATGFKAQYSDLGTIIITAAKWLLKRPQEAYKLKPLPGGDEANLAQQVIKELDDNEVISVDLKEEVQREIDVFEMGAGAPEHKRTIRCSGDDQ